MLKLITIVLILVCLSERVVHAQEPRLSTVQSAIGTSFQLPGKRLAITQSYQLAVDITTQTPVVDRRKQTSYRLDLDCVPTKGSHANSPGQAVKYTCRQFAIFKDGGKKVTIPSLKDWSYEFTYPSENIAPGGNVFGLPNARFAGLSDSDGGKLDSQLEFLVYNAFTDYHVLCNVYAQKMFSGAGIQSLSEIGDTVEHGTSNTHAPLGSIPGLSEGSEFVHGNVTLEFKGISRVGERPCALIGFDARGNEFKMVIEPAPNYSVISQGKSQHFGDLYLDLQTGWVIKAIMAETVVSWVNLNGKQTGPTVMHRSLTLSQK